MPCLCMSYTIFKIMCIMLFSISMDILQKALFVLLLLASMELSTNGRHTQFPNYKESSSGPSEHLVTDLPGQPVVDFKHYAGYLTVNKKNGRALFYWFYEATNLTNEKPLVLWLNGGPGCSSVGYGATQEIGPFLVDKDGRALQLNPFSWNTEANFLFIESPIGVGFSYSNTSADYDGLGDDVTAKDAYTFLHKWFIKFPSYRNRKFYIAGESYAGKYIPELAELIHDNNKNTSLFIDLGGILLGNPATYDAEDWKGMVDYAWSHAVISDETRKNLMSWEISSNYTWTDSNFTDEFYRHYHEIDIFSLYTPTCVPELSGSKQETADIGTSRTLLNMMRGGYDPCLDDYAVSYYNQRDVQKALHVISDGAHHRDWWICNDTVFRRWSDSKASVLPIYQKLIDAKLRIWIYSGDTDGRLPFLATSYSLSSLGLPIKRPWKPWYHQREVGGWIQEYNGLTFATFRGAGHAVPIFKPSASLAFFASFLSGKSPPSRR